MSAISKLHSILRNDGGIYLIDLLLNKIFSQFIRRRFSFGAGLLFHRDADLKGLQCAKIGSHFNVGKRARIEIIRLHNGVRYAPKLVIGSRVSMQDDVHIGCVENINIGDDVLIASKVYISDHNHGSYSGLFQEDAHIPPRLRRISTNPVLIGRNVWIGESVVVLAGVEIGEFSIIGANSVVTSDIPAYSIAVGSPARVIKRYNLSDQIWYRNEK